jgi:hypothetical protein
MVVAEMHAEMAQLRAELESTRAVAARLAELQRNSRAPDPRATLVPVRTSTRVAFWKQSTSQGDKDTSE